MNDRVGEVEVFEPDAVLPALLADPAPRSGLSDKARQRLQRSIPPETRRAYNREWARFLAWCEETGAVALPCPTDTLTNWIADRADAGDSLTALQQAISAVVLTHEFRYGDGSPQVPVTKDAWRLVNDYKKELTDRGWRPNRAATITPEQFRAMMATIPADSPAGIRDRAIMVTTLGALFRRSNTMRLDVGDVSEVVTEMTTDDETDEETRVHLFASRSKTDQAARGRTVVLAPGEHELSDPVAMLLAWVCELEVQGITTGPLFRPIGRSGRILDRRLNDDHVRLLVRNAAKAAGVTNKKGRPYTAHSLRASGVTIARQAGKSWDAIREHGDWKESSPVVLRYDRPEAEGHAMSGIGL